MEHKTIGADIGHCDTTASIPYRAQIKSNRYTNARLALSKDGGVLNSKIFLSNEQMQKLKGHRKPDHNLLCSLGTLEQEQGSQEDGETFCYFKVPPKDFDKPYGFTKTAKVCGITHGTLMACFAFFLVEKIFLLNDNFFTLKDRREIDLLVGCPTTADWTSDQARRDYADLILKATGVHEVRIVPESRAAMFSSIENERNSISTLNGAIIIDFGSSTADCTFMLLGRKLIEFSWSLGASSIEHQMVMHAYNEAFKKCWPAELDIASIVKNEEELRKAKERYYNGVFGLHGRPMFCSFTQTHNSEIIDIPIRIDDQFMRTITEEKDIQIMCDSKTLMNGSWYGLCEAFFREAKAMIENASYSVTLANGKTERRQCTFNTIVLTGGASRMGFVKQLCQQVFSDVPQARIHLEANPSYTVSNGLGWVAVLEERLDDCIGIAKKKVEGNPKCSIQELKTKVSDVVFEYIKQVGQVKTWQWAEDPQDRTMEDLQIMIDEYLKSPEAQKKIASMCETAIMEWKQNLSGVMADAVNEQIRELFSETAARGLIIPPDIWVALQTNGIKMDDISVNNILCSIDMASVMRKIGNVLLWTIALAIAVFVFFPGIFLGFFADDDKNMKKPRKQKTRKKAVNRITGELDKSKDEITKNLMGEFSKFEGEYQTILENTLKTAFEIATLKRFEM